MHLGCIPPQHPPPIRFASTYTVQYSLRGKVQGKKQPAQHSLLLTITTISCYSNSIFVIVNMKTAAQTFNLLWYPIELVPDIK